VVTAPRKRDFARKPTLKRSSSAPRRARRSGPQEVYLRADMPSVHSSSAHQWKGRRTEQGEAPPGGQSGGAKVAEASGGKGASE
jgi:hypothetical protein